MISMIPRTIHQTWKSTELSYPFDVLANSWKELHPSWQYKLWTDDMNRDFIKAHFPDFLSRYDNYPRNIQRIDAFRYFLLLKEGGVYVDVDFECISCIEPLLEGSQCVIGKEPPLHSDNFNMEMILCNAFMAAAPGNPFMQFVCNEVMEYPSIDVENAVDVLKTTGPFILTHAYEKFIQKEDVTILEHDTLYPLTMFETRKVLNDTITEDMQKRIDQAFAVHYFWGSW
jgi:inositol phosphorylceramide mannosyltransferase catalytic subunit